MFHFLTPVAQGTGANGNPYSFSFPYATLSFWQLNLEGGTTSAYAYQDTYADGTSSAYFTDGQQTLDGVDFTVPVSSFGGGSTLDYYFEPQAGAYIYGNGRPETTLSASITATLSGIDAVNANDVTVASAVFNADGTSTLDFNSTVPEPSSMALLGTGLIGLVPLARRRLK